MLTDNRWTRNITPCEADGCFCNEHLFEAWERMTYGGMQLPQTPFWCRYVVRQFVARGDWEFHVVG